VLTLGTRHALVHLSQVVSAQVTGQGVGYSLGTSVAIRRRVYTAFAGLMALVVLADLGDVTVASVSWVSWQAAGSVLTWALPFPSSAFLGSLAFWVVFMGVGRFAFVIVALAFSSLSRAVTWRSCRYLAYAVSEQEGGDMAVMPLPGICG